MNRRQLLAFCAAAPVVALLPAVPAEETMMVCTGVADGKITISEMTRSEFHRHFPALDPKNWGR